MAPRFEALFIFWIKEITGVRAIDRAPGRSRSSGGEDRTLGSACDARACFVLCSRRECLPGPAFLPFPPCSRSPAIRLFAGPEHTFPTRCLLIYYNRIIQTDPPPPGGPTRPLHERKKEDPPCRSVRSGDQESDARVAPADVALAADRGRRVPRVRRADRARFLGAGREPGFLRRPGPEALSAHDRARRDARAHRRPQRRDARGQPVDL